MMVTKIDVLILIEHKVREFETAVLTKYFFEQKGYSVAIDSIRFNKEETFLKYQPKIVFLPYAYTKKSINRAHPLCRFHNNPLFVNYHHEQMSFDGKYTHLPRDSAVNTIHLSWGQQFTDALINAGCKEESIITIGNPRLDFYSQKLRKIGLSREELANKYSLNLEKKWILYIGDPTYLCLNNINPGNSEIYNKRKQYYEIGSSNRIKLLEYLEKLGNDKYEFIYRPHPSYAELDRNDDSTINMSRNPAFHFISDESIRDWILNVDKVLTFNSTSSIECAAADVPFYLFRIVENVSKFEYNILKDYEYKVVDFESFITALNSSKMDFSQFKKRVENEIMLSNIGNVIEKLVERTIEYLPNEKLGRIGFNRINVFKTRIRCWLKKIISFLRNSRVLDKIIKSKKDVRLLNVSKYGDDVFSQAEIDTLLSKIKKNIRLEKESNILIIHDKNNNAINLTKPYIIAEVSQNHDGSLGQAHAFIDACADCGVDAVKFQCHIASEESTKYEQFRVNFSYEDKTRYDYWKRMEFTEEQWEGLFRHAKERNIDFLCSVFSQKAFEIMERLGIKAWKFGAGEVFNDELLDSAIKTGKPILLSTGLSTWDDIDYQVNKVHNNGNQLVLFQCVTAYPSKSSEIDISKISEFKKKYGCLVGISDHSSTIYPSLSAIALGAMVVEVHVTMNKYMFGPDVKASVDLNQLKEIVEGSSFIYEMLQCHTDFSTRTVDRENLKKLFSKSIYYTREMKKGEIVQKEDLKAKKPNIGVDSKKIELFYGRVLNKDVGYDEPLMEGDFEQ